MIPSKKAICLAVALQWLVGCDSKENRATNAIDQAPQLVAPAAEAKPKTAIRRSADHELLARHPSHPISIIEEKTPRPSGGKSARPMVYVERATSEGRLRLVGPCLYLESDTGKVGLVFRNQSARFDEASSELVVAGIRVPIDEKLFVRALWWGPSFEGHVLRPEAASSR